MLLFVFVNTITNLLNKIDILKWNKNNMGI